VITDRRNFLGTLIGGIAGAAAVRTWPFRVYSFPLEISPAKLLVMEYVKLVNGTIIVSPRQKTGLWYYNHALELVRVSDPLPHPLVWRRY